MKSARRLLASALDILPLLRERFAALMSSQILGLSPPCFSWSSKQGRCETCQGKGYIEYIQKYAPPLKVECSDCNGDRLNKRALSPRLRGKNFADILALSIEDALSFFANDRQIRSRLESAVEFGLGYLRLDQSLDSLSGGEMQRLVLTLELKKSKIAGMWYLLSHPSTGLHLPDIDALGVLLRRLTEQGATFVLIENREEFVQFADHIIEF